MKTVVEFVKKLLVSIMQTEQQRREAYLAKSADIHDLEYRMRELDRQESYYSWVAFTRHGPTGSM